MQEQSEEPSSAIGAREAGEDNFPLEEETPEETDSSGKDLFHISFRLPSLFWKLLLTVLILGGGGTAAVFSYKKKKQREEAAMLERRRRRAERLRETGVSEAEFDLMMQSRREQKGSKKR